MNFEEVAQLKKQLEEEYKKRTEAIDIVLDLLKERNTTDNVQEESVTAREQLEPVQASTENTTQDTTIVKQSPTARKFDFDDHNTTELTFNVEKTENNKNSDTTESLNGAKFGRVRDAGVKGVAKQAVPFLPLYFTRKELQETMEEHFPEWGDKLTKDAMNGAVRRLEEDGYIEIHKKSGGKIPNVYRKLKDI